MKVRFHVAKLFDPGRAAQATSIGSSLLHNAFLIHLHAHEAVYQEAEAALLARVCDASEPIGMETTVDLCPTSFELFDGLFLRHHICHLRLDVEYVRIVHSFRAVPASLTHNLYDSEPESIFLNAKAYDWTITQTHCIQCARSHAATRADTTYDQCIDALYLQTCAEVCREKSAGISFSNDKFTSLGL